jgi:uncharacterized protein HemY
MRRRTLALVILVSLLLVLAVGLYVGNATGELPWQEDPTRISTSLTPFADLGVPTFAVPTAAGASAAPPAP